MEATALSVIAAACGGILVCGDGAQAVSSVSKDTRTLQAGDLYWALQGDNFDGHDFMAEAFEAGALAAVVSRDTPAVAKNFPLIRVDDTLIALQRLAGWHRQRLKAKVICLTGSNGKTSTKDFTASVAATRFSVTKTQGNFNNHIGLPLTILSACSSDEVAVWEIGMNQPGEIEPLARLARPDIGVITNVGVAHIEFFDSCEAIAREKGMLGHVLSPEALLILPAYDPFTPSLVAQSKARLVLAGSPEAVRAEKVQPSLHGLDFQLVERETRAYVHLPVAGEHMVRNALLAVEVGRALGLSLDECASGLAATKLSGQRLASSEVRGVTMIDDTYNANPDSMEAALHALHELPGVQRRLAVLGHMGELGSYADEGYRRVGRAAGATMDILIAVGPEAGLMVEEASGCSACDVRPVADAAEAVRLLLQLARPGDAVVVKGSRAARMERVVEGFA